MQVLSSISKNPSNFLIQRNMDSSSSPDDAFFNDLTRGASQTNNTPPESTGAGGTGEERDVLGLGRPKRIACVICRKRKLRCDGIKPTCGTCSRLNHQCAYDEVRRKSGPKRGYVKELEARLGMQYHLCRFCSLAKLLVIAQVETQLKSKNTKSHMQPRAQIQSRQPFVSPDTDTASGSGDHDMMSGFASMTANMSSGQKVPNVTVTSESNDSTSPDFPWEMIGLGLEEPLPPQDMIDEL